MLKKSRKKISIDDLARMVQSGFTEVHEKMDKGFTEVHSKMNKGFTEVHEKFKDMATKEDIAGIKQRLSNIDNRLDNVATHERRLVRLEKKVGFLPLGVATGDN